MNRKREKIIEKRERLKNEKSKENKILKRINSQEKKKKNKEKRKKREHYLIKVGALFEIVDLLDEPQQLLLGYLMQFQHLTDDQRKNLFYIGKLEFEKRERDKKNKNLINQEEIIELLKTGFNKKNIDPLTEIYKRTKKKNLESITKQEYSDLINYFSN